LQKFLLICISRSVNTAVAEKSELTGGFIGNDKRGEKTPPNKTKPEVIDRIKSHTEKFPTQEGHYCRKTSNRKYLDPKLSIKKRNELLVEHCQKKRTQLFHQKKNIAKYFAQSIISFFSPKKDQCLICANYNRVAGDSKNALEEEYKEHQKRKEEANASKAIDRERTCTNPKFVSATFDLQSVLQIPSSDVSALYYSQKLCVYNLAIYEAVPPNKALCFAWTENNDQRGSCEIGTALLQWFETSPQNVEEVSLFSDT
jgi:hypothetical protein